MQSSRGPNEAHESRGFDYQFDIASEREFENIREVITPGGGDRQLFPRFANPTEMRVAQHQTSYMRCSVHTRCEGEQDAMF